MYEKEKTNWGNMPSSLLGWVLWSIREKIEFNLKQLTMVIIIWTVAIAVVFSGLFVGYELHLIRSNQIEKTRLEIFDEQWKISSEPEWRAALLKTWIDPKKPKKISYEIWMEAAQDNNKQVKKAVAIKVGAPIECKKLLMGDERPDIRLPAKLSIIKSKNDLSNLINDQDKTIREVLASNQKTPKEILEKLSKDNNKDVIIRISSNPKTPVEILNKLSENIDIKILVNIAANPSTPIQTLEILSKINNEDLLLAILSRSDISNSILEKFAKDKTKRTKVIKSVAENTKTPTKLLYDLHRQYFDIIKGKYSNSEKESAYLICVALAQNISTPAVLLENFYVDFDSVFINYNRGLFFERLDYYLAKNSSTPIDILRKLSDDKKVEIRTNVSGNPSLSIDLIEKLSNDQSDDVILSLVDNSSVPMPFLKKIINNINSRKNNVEILEKIATRTDLTREIINILFEKNEERSLVALASNSAITQDILLKLSKSSHLGVIKAVAENKYTPPTILQKLYENHKSEMIPYLAANESTPDKILKSCLYENKDIKLKLAQNVSTPFETLIILSSDDDQAIRLEAFASFIKKLDQKEL